MNDLLKSNKLPVGVAVAVATILGWVGVASAQAEASGIITTGVDTLEAELLLVAAAVIAVAVIFLAIRKGWGMVTRMVR